MKIISSRQNQAVKHVAALHTKKYRQEHQQFIAEGYRTLQTLIEAGHAPKELYSTQGQLTRAQELASPELITLVEDHVMEKMSTSTTPCGLLGLFAMPKSPAPSATIEPGLVLAQVTDAGNMGTLVRTAAALKKPNIVLIEGTDPWSPKAVQSSAGTIGMLTIFHWSWQEFLENKSDFPAYALVVSGGKAPNELDLANAWLVVGSEAYGLPDEWVAACDEKLTLPMPGKTESLNAAIAGSIALYLSSIHTTRIC